jgi:hypothetical protein
MKKTKEFEFGGKNFQLIAYGSGKEEILHHGRIVSSLRSLLGGTHQFTLEGKNYELRVKMDANFEIHVSGKVDGVWLVKPKKVFPTYLIAIGGTIMAVSVARFFR